MVDLDEADVAVNVAWSYLPFEANEAATRNLDLFNQTQREIIVDWLEWYVLGEEETWHDLLVETPNKDRGRNTLRDEVQEQVNRYRQKLGEWQRLVYS